MGCFIPGFLITMEKIKVRQGDDVLKLLCILLVIACGFDYRKRRIPNLLIVVMLITGIGECALSWGMKGILSFLCKMICMVLGMYFFFWIGTLGAGDVKLFGVCAGYFPGNKILYFLFFSLLITAGISFVKLLFGYCVRKSSKTKKSVAKLQWNVYGGVKERLSYLCQYIFEVVQSGHWKLYIEDREEWQRNGICLAGPILGSVLMYIGGVY